MSISMTAGARRTTAKALSQYRVARKAPDRLVLQAKRIAALLGDAASDIEQMIRLAAKLRKVTGLGLRTDRVA